jgi:hypothetical protein
LFTPLYCTIALICCVNFKLIAVHYNKEKIHIPIWDLTFSWWRRWWLQSSGLWCHVVLWVVTNISEECITSIFTSPWRPHSTITQKITSQLTYIATPCQPWGYIPLSTWRNQINFDCEGIFSILLYKYKFKILHSLWYITIFLNRFMTTASCKITFLLWSFQLSSEITIKQLLTWSTISEFILLSSCFQVSHEVFVDTQSLCTL